MAAKKLTVVTDHPEGFSRDMALFWLDAIENQHERVVSIALAGIAYEESLVDEARNPVLGNLFAVIQDATEQLSAIGKLRAMLETLPKEVAHA
jgi:hypothetical protein